MPVAENIRFHSIASLIPGDEPPREFRLFVAGWNESENGSCLFDESAAAAVMAAYERHGVDRMIDLEHLSLAQESTNYDPDARGWFKLELRPDGSLWAVDVRWTPDGERRLRDKLQRYTSPAFRIDTKTKRVSKLLNVAITALPATHDTPALVAASLTRNSMMDESGIKSAIEALKNGDGESALAVLEAMLVAAASGESAPADAPAESAPEAAAVEPPKPEDEEEKQEYAAARVKLFSLTGRESVGEALADVELWRAAFLNQAEERAKIAKSQEVLDANERRSLIAQLVAAGNETPATAWENPLAKVLRPCKRLASEPIVELRDRVAKLTAGRRVPTPKIPTAPDDTMVLSAREKAMCADMKIDPAEYVARRDSLLSKRS